MAGMKLAGTLLLWTAAMTQAANYTAERIQVEGFDVIRLADEKTSTEVRILPSFGNNAYQMTVRGQNVLWPAYQTLREWKAKPTQMGNPFLAPWVNRIDGDSYFANGKQYTLNSGLGNFRRDGNGKPIHGLLVYASWDVKSLRADDREAVLVSRLEFWRNPDWLAQFPFAHNIEMIHRLRDGVLEVETVLENLSHEPMPVSLGYHSYYQVPDAPRDEWQVHLAARERLVLSKELVPTGERTKLDLPDPMPLGGAQLDDGFTSLVREANGRAVFWVRGKRQKIEVEFGPNYPVSVVYAPRGRPFICFEPMSGVTNVFNLAHEGKFPLQSVPPGGAWRESFWVRPSGF